MCILNQNLLYLPASVHVSIILQYCIDQKLAIYLLPLWKDYDFLRGHVFLIFSFPVPGIEPIIQQLLNKCLLAELINSKADFKETLRMVLFWKALWRLPRTSVKSCCLWIFSLSFWNHKFIPFLLPYLGQMEIIGSYFFLKSYWKT